MANIEVDGKSYETDEEGYLVNLAEWNKDVADYIAQDRKHQHDRRALGSRQFPARILRRIPDCSGGSRI